MLPWRAGGYIALSCDNINTLVCIPSVPAPWNYSLLRDFSGDGVSAH